MTLRYSTILTRHDQYKQQRENVNSRELDEVGSQIFITTILVFHHNNQRQRTTTNKLSELSVLILNFKVVWALARPSAEHIRYKSVQTRGVSSLFFCLWWNK